MAQLGLPASGTAAPATGFFNDDFGNCQFWSGAYTMPAGGGIVTDLFVYCAGDGVTATAQLVIWGASGILWQSSNITLPSGSQSIGGQGWQHVLVPNVYVPAGTVNLGFWSSGHVVWTYESTGSTNFQRSLASGPAALSSGGTEGLGALGAYITYTPGGVAQVFDGTVWQDGTVPQIYDGTTWQQPTAQVYDGTTWNPTT